MAGYVGNDALIKRATEQIPEFQAVMLRGAFLAVFVFLISIRELPSWNFTALKNRPLLLRVFCEMAATVLFILALARIPLAAISAAMGIIPLLVSFAAAKMLGETMSSIRVFALGIGFIGMLLVAQPGTDAFTPWFLVVLVAASLITVREIATRVIPKNITGGYISMITAIATLIGATALSMTSGWVTPTAKSWFFIVSSALVLALAYVASVITLRHGDVSYSALFRYSGILFAIILEIVLFSTVPALPVLTGCALIAGAGLMVMIRERKTNANQSPAMPASANSFTTAAGADD